MPANNPSKTALAKKLRLEMTPAETRLWEKLRTNRLGGYHFRRQHVIVPYIVDFYCHQARLVIEVDGGVHQDRMEYDQQRDEFLQAHGLRVLRFTNTDVIQHLDSVLEEILRMCKLFAGD